MCTLITTPASSAFFTTYGEHGTSKANITDPLPAAIVKSPSVIGPTDEASILILWEDPRNELVCYKTVSKVPTEDDLTIIG